MGNAIKNGIPVAIIGETNAGKSTLLNLLLNEEKAIVSDIHGTTRDVIEDTINLNGITFRFIDTAGIRETSDTIESLGIERTYQKMEQATLVLWVIDLTSPDALIETLAHLIEPKLSGKKVILVFNKADLLTPQEVAAKQNLLDKVQAENITISAKFKNNTDRLQTKLVEAANLPEVGQNDVIVTNIRHYEALTRALEAIQSLSENREIRHYRKKESRTRA